MTPEKVDKKSTALGSFVSHIQGIDLISFLNVTIGLLALIILLCGTWVFVFFVYKPIFTPVKQVEIARPSINHTLLDALLTQSRKRQEVLTSPLTNHYDSPFR